jgi:hypothetical protein
MPATRTARTCLSPDGNIIAESRLEKQRVQEKTARGGSSPGGLSTRRFQQ